MTSVASISGLVEAQWVTDEEAGAAGPSGENLSTLSSISTEVLNSNVFKNKDTPCFSQNFVSKVV